MNDSANERVGLTQNPPHLGELIRERMDDVGWNISETVARLGCERGRLPHLLPLVHFELAAWGARRAAQPDAWSV